MTESETYGFLMTTVARKTDAVAIADALIDGKLAACVQMMPIESRYMWHGEKNVEPELLLLIKTRTVLFDEAVRAIEAIHPYEVPEIVVTNFVTGSAGYFSWIDEVTKPRE